MSSSTRERINPDDLIVGRTYRVINQWYAYNYMNECVEIYTGEYVKKIHINDNITIVFLVNGREKYVNSVNNFYLVDDNPNK
jgi:hypothetical protein